MKKKDMILIGGCLCLAFLAWLFLGIFGPKDHRTVRITVNGEIYGEYSLEEPQVIKIGDTNVCEIRDGKVKMTEADCPDQLCVHQKAVDETGGTIVCLPNQVVIEAVGKQEASADAVT